MLLISHRGHIDGPNTDLSNNPEQIKYLYNRNFDIEIDLRTYQNNLYLGHDKADYKTSLNFLISMKDKLWIHCKDYTTFNYLQNFKDILNFFWHNNDDYTITSKGYVWIYPNKPIIKDGIEVITDKDQTIERFKSKNSLYGICTDYLLI